MVMAHWHWRADTKGIDTPSFRSHVADAEMYCMQKMWSIVCFCWWFAACRPIPPVKLCVKTFGEISWLGNRLTQVYIDKWLLKLHVWSDCGDYQWFLFAYCLPSVRWCCWLGNSKGIWLVKNWMLVCCLLFLTEAKYKWFAYVIEFRFFHLLLQQNRE